METRNRQHTRLAKKKETCRIAIMRQAWLGTHLHRIGIRPDP
jgi:hypothetical protein